MPWSAQQEINFQHSIEASHPTGQDLPSHRLAVTIPAYRENHPYHFSGRQETRGNNRFSAGLPSELQELLIDNEGTRVGYLFHIPLSFVLLEEMGHEELLLEYLLYWLPILPAIPDFCQYRYPSFHKRDLLLT